MFKIFILDYAILKGRRWQHVLIFICISLMFSDAEHLFIYLFAICVSSLQKCLSRSFVHFKNQVIWFFAIELYEFLIYFVYLSIIRYMVYKYFLLSCRLPFPFVDCLLCCAKTFYFDVVPFVFVLFCFCLVYCAFGVISKISLPDQCQETFSLCFLLGELWSQVLHLTL